MGNLCPENIIFFENENKCDVIVNIQIIYHGDLRNVYKQVILIVVKTTMLKVIFILFKIKSLNNNLQSFELWI